MKVFAFFLLIGGIGNILIGILSRINTDRDAGQLLMGLAFIVASVFAFNKANKQKREKEKFDEWNNN
ncbi:MAG: hypothetical protein LBT78_05355 [Tannerella sp.]|nr:hypothetical protein [Tannerella sp.]